MTLTLSVTAMISRSLWVIRTMVRPWRLEVAQDAEQMVGLLRREHAGGLVEDQERAPRNRAFRISTRCWTPTGRLADQRVEIDLESRSRARAP